MAERFKLRFGKGRVQPIVPRCVSVSSFPSPLHSQPPPSRPQPQASESCFTVAGKFKCVDTCESSLVICADQLASSSASSLCGTLGDAFHPHPIHSSEFQQACFCTTIIPRMRRRGIPRTETIRRHLAVVVTGIHQQHQHQRQRRRTRTTPSHFDMTTWPA